MRREEIKKRDNNRIEGEKDMAEDEKQQQQKQSGGWRGTGREGIMDAVKLHKKNYMAEKGETQIWRRECRRMWEEIKKEDKERDK